MKTTYDIESDSYEIHDARYKAIYYSEDCGHRHKSESAAIKCGYKTFGQNYGGLVWMCKAVCPIFWGVAMVSCLQ